MRISLERLNNATHFRARTPDDVSIEIDGSADVGGMNLGIRPMQMLLAALGGCSGIDVVMVLQKKRQRIDTFMIDVDGDRTSVDDHSVWTKINVTFTLTGAIEPDKARHAIDLSLGKYCSVAKTLEAFAVITFTLVVNNVVIADHATAVV
jgi:putative redox protein